MNIFANEMKEQKLCSFTYKSNDTRAYFFQIYSYFFISKDNISHNKIATQLHTYTGTIGTNRYDASNAVDGKTETCMRTKEIGPRSPNKAVWWKVDLGGVLNIYSINILFKNYETIYGAYYVIISHKTGLNSIILLSEI